MTISFERALGVHTSALKLHTQRAAVLANNLANADTPGFKARDIDFKDILKNETTNRQYLPLKATSKQHLFAPLNAIDNSTLYRTPLQPSINGNTVEEQVEHAEYMKNAMRFQFSFTKVNGTFKDLLKAIKGD